MFVDSHCHINFPELASDLPNILAMMEKNQVSHALCVSVNLKAFPQIRSLAERYPNIYGSVGVHPDDTEANEVRIDELVKLAAHPKIIAIGETGLDYFRSTGDLTWQQDRFRVHIRAAKLCQKPLIIHTRDAVDDTLTILNEEQASMVGGVMHCFTESLEMAKAAMEMNFYVSFSGIVTFKNAGALKEVAKTIPLDRLLIETDSPYLAPVPHRGKTNQPAYVAHVAEEIARLRNISIEEVAAATTRNFFTLFKLH